MKEILKKFGALICCIALVASSSMIVFAGDEYEVVQEGEEISACSLSQIINLNGDPLKFSNIMKIVKSEDTGKNVIYLPLRLAFTNFEKFMGKNETDGLDEYFVTSVNDREFKNNLVKIATSYPTDEQDVNGTLYDNKGVAIDWRASAKENTGSKYGALVLYYGNERDVITKEVPSYVYLSIPLNHDIIIETVDSSAHEGRLFLSLEDWQVIVDYLAKDGYTTEVK